MFLVLRARLLASLPLLGEYIWTRAVVSCYCILFFNQYKQLNAVAITGETGSSC